MGSLIIEIRKYKTIMKSNVVYRWRFIPLLMLLPLFVQAQQIGGAGKLLQNEARRTFTPPIVSGQHPDYRWEMNYELGYAEVFIRIPERGRFTVQLGDQEMTSSTGMFRFFDVPVSNQKLTIFYGRNLIYRVTIYPKNETRLLLDFFSNGGLFLLDELELRTNQQNYYGNRWSDIWNQFYGKRIMKGNDFEQFFKNYCREPFDDDKMKYYQMLKGTTVFTTQQIGQLMEQLSFETNRLSLAKEATDEVVDPQNLYMLYDFFQFKSTADRFRDYLINKQQ
ncbi:hypothetical protein CGC47_03165 [Capnocytophaga canimorsus]|nr:hypothetical protein CGC47_03165 [Capnocytophaga canimorsus]